MSQPTDPARELADLCKRLQEPTEQPGDQYLAVKFGVPAWSTEFYQIIFSIATRADELSDLIAGLEMDDDIKTDVQGHIEGIKTAFTPNGLNNPWRHAVTNYINQQNVGPIRALSQQVRQARVYPRLEPNEVAELVEQVDELTSWLVDHQQAEQDFIRQAIIEGLEHFRFRLTKMEWLGWGYTVISLREVISAYMALERGFTDPASAPDMAAVLKKTGEFIKDVIGKVGVAKKVVETGDFALKAYGALTLAVQGHQSIAGFLSAAS